MLKRIWSFGKELMEEMKHDRAIGLAAEQAFFYMLALFPLMILFLSILPYLSIDEQRLLTLIHSLLPSETAGMIEENVLEIVHRPNQGLLTFGIVAAIWSASNGMNTFIKVMNQTFDAKHRRHFLKARLLSGFLTLLMLMALVLILVLSIFGEVILHTITQYILLPAQVESFFQVLRWLITIVVMITLLCALYYTAPNIELKIKHVIPGAVIATILWQLISAGFSFYVNNFGNYSAFYGSLGGIIVLMLWLFLTGLVLVIGGEWNAILLRKK